MTKDIHISFLLTRLALGLVFVPSLVFGIVSQDFFLFCSAALATSVETIMLFRRAEGLPRWVDWGLYSKYVAVQLFGIMGLALLFHGDSVNDSPTWVVLGVCVSLGFYLCDILVALVRLSCLEKNL